MKLHSHWGHYACAFKNRLFPKSQAEQDTLPEPLGFTNHTIRLHVLQSVAE